MEKQENGIVRQDNELLDLSDHRSLAEKAQDVMLAVSVIAEMKKKLQDAAIKMTRPQDWTNQGGKPYLTEPGANKAASICPIKTVCLNKPTKTFHEDDTGPYYIYQCEYSAIWTISGMGDTSAIGTASSKDPLYSMRGGVRMPMQEVDEPNIIKKCGTNGRNNAIKRLLGLQNLSWDDLSEYGITENNVQKVEYGTNKPADKNPERTKEKREEIRTWVLEMSGDDAKEAGDYLQAITEFKAKDGKVIPGKRNVKDLSEARVNIAHKNIKEKYDEFKKHTE